MLTTPPRKNPRKIYPNADPPETGHIKVRCEGERSGSVGPPGPDAYEHEPRSSFQARARARPSEKLQHVTAVFPPATVERV